MTTMAKSSEYFDFVSHLTSELSASASFVRLSINALEDQDDYENNGTLIDVAMLLQEVNNKLNELAGRIDDSTYRFDSIPLKVAA